MPLGAQAGDPPFEGVIAPAVEDSVPAWPRMAKAPEGAPNIVVILLDDTGFADTALFGGLVEVPYLARLASEGLRYNNFNVTAMCSPTRAALLTGRNHHRVGFGIITETSQGYPGYDSYWKQSTASVAEVLRQSGFSTAAFGKWHNTPGWEILEDGPFDRWPTGLGFEYFYGFQGAEDNHWEPNRLYRNTTPVEAPARPEEGYHLTTDLADDAIAWLDRQRSTAPDKPYFLYFATGAAHTPHHAPRDWIERFKGRFDAGWDVLREQVFANQKRLGVVPADAVLTPRPKEIPAWESLSADEQRLAAREMEVYAAFIAHTDWQLGRLLEHVRKVEGADEETLVFYIAGDNGAPGRNLPGYGGPATLQENLARLDDLGGPLVPYNDNAPGWGWMGNTPFKYWKTVASHFGGLRAPMVVSWSKRGLEAGGLRQQFTHVTDVVPTIYEVAGITPPDSVRGVTQQPIDGTSLLSTLFSRDAPATHRTQYFELARNRAIYHDGWMASALSPFMSDDGNGEDWELYHVAEDFTQSRDLAERYPERLAELKAMFAREAQANAVYPLGGAGFGALPRPWRWTDKTRLDFYQRPGSISVANLPSFNRTHALEAEIVVPEGGAQGVVATFGFRNKGFAWYFRNGQLVYENRVGVKRDLIVGNADFTPGRHVVRYVFACTSCDSPGRARETMSGTGRLLLDGKVIAEQELPAVNLNNVGETWSFHLGQAGGSRISDTFTAPFAFNGTIERLSIVVDQQAAKGQR